METPSIDNQITPITSAAGELLDQVNRAEVKDDASADTMTDLVKYAKTQFKKAEDARKRLVKPLNDHVKWINGEFKKATEPLAEVEKIAKGKLGTYMAEKRREQEEEARKQREAEEAKRLAEAEALEQQGDAEGAEAKLNEAVDVPEQSQAPAVQRGNYGGTASTRKTYDAKVVDIVALAKERPDLLTLNTQQAVRELRAGTTIAGVELVEDETVVIR